MCVICLYGMKKDEYVSANCVCELQICFKSVLTTTLSTTNVDFGYFLKQTNTNDIHINPRYIEQCASPHVVNGQLAFGEEGEALEVANAYATVQLNPPHQ
jgi:hypothetical protein